jgi:hypothetical protein
MMRRMSIQRVVVIGAVLAAMVCSLSGCPAPTGTTGGGGGGGGTAINPGACGKIDGNSIGRKVHAFLVASAELDRASIELESGIAASCRRMAKELGVPQDGDTRTVCSRAAKELEANLQVSVKSESRLVTRYQPAVCKTEIDFAASVVAECEARASADVNVTCEGSCRGTCNGACAGQCSSGGGGGQCNGTCNGTCNGRCSGGCDGYANVEASAECKASAEVRASLRTECSEPKVEVVRENVTIVDDSKFQMAMAAIDAGMPQILRAGKKLELAGKAFVIWAKTAVDLVGASGKLVKEIGEKGVCVGAQLAAAVAATANIQARFTVSIEVSAQVSASAGAQAQ